MLVYFGLGGVFKGCTVFCFGQFSKKQITRAVLLHYNYIAPSIARNLQLFFLKALFIRKSNEIATVAAFLLFSGSSFMESTTFGLEKLLPELTKTGNSASLNGSVR